MSIERSNHCSRFVLTKKASYILTPRNRIKIFIVSCFIALVLSCLTCISFRYAYSEPLSINSLRNIEAEFVGNVVFSNQELAPFLRRISISTALVEDAEDILSQLIDKYKDLGYYDIYIHYSISNLGSKQKVIYTITEGKKGKISAVNINGEFSDDIIAYRDSFIEHLLESSPSKPLIRKAENELLSSVRQQGYLQAKINYSKAPMSIAPGKVELNYDISLGLPIKFKFNGNISITADEIVQVVMFDDEDLEHIMLNPWGPWAISNFCKKVKLVYESRGFFLATVDCEDSGRVNGSQVYTIDIKEGISFVLGSITFLNNNSIAADKLLQVMQTNVTRHMFSISSKPRLISKILAEDLATIQDYYVSEGYTEVKVSFQIETQYDKGEIYLQILIDEGVAKTIQSLEVKWLDGYVSRLDDLKKFDIEEYAKDTLLHAIWKITSFESVRQNIETRLKSFGFPATTVDLRTNEDSNVVTFAISTGHLTHIGQIVARGNLITDKNVLYRKLSVKQEDIWNDTLIESSVKRLYESGLFRTVSIEPLDGKYDSDIEDLAVIVSEREPAYFRLSALYNTEDGVKLQAEKNQRNWNGSGESITVGIDGMIKTRFIDSGRAWITYKIPEFLSNVFDTPKELQIETYELIASKLHEGFSYDRVGISIGLKEPIIATTRVYIGLDEYRERVFDYKYDVAFGRDDRGTKNYAKIRSEIEYDDRDSELAPTSGTRCNITCSIASAYIGSDVDYGELVSECAHWFKFDSPFSLALRVLQGYIRPFEATNVAPLSSRFFLGGRDTLRGFSPGAIGPRSEEGNIVGGDFEILSNTELSYLISESIAVLSFLDLGQAFLIHSTGFNGKDSNNNDIRISPGFGLRYLTPIGPISAEYGLAIFRNNGERPGRFFVGIGAAF